MPHVNNFPANIVNAITADQRSYQDINKEIYWICIAMASLIALLILIALCFVAHEEWAKYREHKFKP